MVIMATSCEKVAFDDYESESETATATGNVTIRVTTLEQTDFGDGVGAKSNNSDLSSGATRAATSIDEVCTRIEYGFFQNGEKIETESQTSSSSNFGTITMELDSGSYQMVVIAHNGEGKATISTEEKVTFSNNKVTDTFWYYGDIEVGNESNEYEIEVCRVVAMFRLNITGEIPDSASVIEFYYTGGSSTMSAKTGYGVVNSRQTEERDIVEGQTEYDIYTIPHEDTDELKIVTTVYDADGNTIYSATFEDVPVTVNRITKYSGDLFSYTSDDDDDDDDSDDDDDDSSSSNSLELSLSGITTNDEWLGVDEYTF